MNNLKFWIAFTALSLGSVLVACGDDESTGGAGSTSSTTGSNNTNSTTTTTTSSAANSGSSSTGNNGFPAAPTLGTNQLDRMGRAAVNTALNETFVKTNGGVGPSDDTLRDASEDTFNATKDATQWGPTFRVTAATQLAVLDGLDGTCGNQPLSCTDGKPNIECYGGLADVLMNDRLWVATSFATCTSYLGQEIKVITGMGNDCGGRRPVDDVIATTYTLLSGAAAFDDGITAPQGLHPEAFPYFAAPH